MALKMRDQQILQQRRAKLRALLAEDEELFRLELESLKETSQQKAHRMLTHARDLKRDREQRRRQFAQDQYARQWRLGCDELRTIDSDRFAAHCHQEVGVQRMERMQRGHTEREEERVWSEKSEFDRRARAKRDQAEAADRRQKLVENKTALLDQMQELENRRQQETNQREQDRLEFQNQMEFEATLARIRQQEQLDLKRKQQQEVVHFNTHILAERRAAKQRQLEEEQRVINRKMAEFKEETEQRATDKEALRREIARYQQFLKDQAASEAAIEKEMERMVAADLAKSNGKRDAQWERERLAREKLMQDVYAGRAQQMQEKQMDQVKRDAELQLEKEAAEREIAKARMLEMQEEKEEKAREQARRYDLEKQIAFNKQQQNYAIHQRNKEREFADQAEAQYRSFLEQEKRQAAARQYKPRSFGLTNAFTSFQDSALVGQNTQQPSTQQGFSQ